ncbi:hypothetical protein [Mycolicibacterium sp. A43C]
MSTKARRIALRRNCSHSSRKAEESHQGSVELDCSLGSQAAYAGMDVRFSHGGELVDDHITVVIKSGLQACSADYPDVHPTVCWSPAPRSLNLSRRKGHPR